MKKVLIIGAANLQHTVNFINTLLLDCPDKQITLFNTEYRNDLESEYEAFYANNSIGVIGARKLSRSKNGKIRAILNLLNMTLALLRACRKDKQYDMCFVLYCSWQSSIWVSGFHRFFNKIILVYFGSDVLRNNRLNTFYFKKMNKLADYIVLPNLHTLEVFNNRTENLYESKSWVIQYPQKMERSMRAYEPLRNQVSDREFFGLPVDKVVVLCGHTATKEEQYEDMIYSLSKCRPDVLDKCYFVFMMTYAPNDCREYQNHISTLLEQSRLDGKVLTTRIKYENMPKLHYACDIHITTIQTDAFSCFLQEEMLAGNILIYGKWLNYHEIENERFYAFPLDSIEKLCDIFNDVIDNFEDNRKKSKINIKGIMELASEESIRKEWNHLVFQKNDMI